MKECNECPECGKPRISFGWCKRCETNAMREIFPYWTSENKSIDNISIILDLIKVDILKKI